MTGLFSSFYSRLSALFLVLLILIGAIYIMLSYRSSIDFVQETDQRMNSHLAQSIALEIKPLVQDSIHTAEMAFGGPIRPEEKPRLR